MRIFYSSCWHCTVFNRNTAKLVEYSWEEPLLSRLMPDETVKPLPQKKHGLTLPAAPANFTL